jgi:hypothetical protein
MQGTTGCSTVVVDANGTEVDVCVLTRECFIKDGKSLMTEPLKNHIQYEFSDGCNIVAFAEVVGKFWHVTDDAVAILKECHKVSITTTEKELQSLLIDISKLRSDYSKDEQYKQDMIMNTAEFHTMIGWLCAIPTGCISTCLCERMRRNTELELSVHVLSRERRFNEVLIEWAKKYS